MSERKAMATSDEHAANLGNLFAEAGIIGNALMVGDHDDAREWSVDLARRPKELGQTAVTAAAVQLIAHLGPIGTGPASGFGPALNRLSDALDEARG
jgi:hypothetical protein